MYIVYKTETTLLYIMATINIYHKNCDVKQNSKVIKIFFVSSCFGKGNRGAVPRGLTVNASTMPARENLFNFASIL